MNFPPIPRRQFLGLVSAASGAMLLPEISRAETVATLPPAATAPVSFPLVKFPEKSQLLMLSDRPPDLEMPLSGFAHDITPNELFFVRWHLSVIPTSVDLKTFRLKVSGEVESELNLSIEDLRRQFEPVSVIAVNQCSGNSRALFSPRVMGGQWGNGAMGNAKWTGVRLKDVLAKAKIKAGAVEVAFRGLDAAPIVTVPPFEKSLSVAKAQDADVMIAYEMNDQPMPMLNGFPLRLVVPGWYATYWMKALNSIRVVSKPFTGFWMAKSYRVPKNPDCQEAPTNLAKDTIPINEMTVRSLFFKPAPNERIAANSAYEVQGLAIDGGKGMKKVEVSDDGGKTWAEAKLDKELGPFSWRRWRFLWQPPKAGQHTLMARATNAAGQTQTVTQWNHSGYARNQIESVSVTVT
jgi:DMSO/TMAO reductase YedYZ molybdopterin-dependent catalytic subunit